MLELAVVKRYLGITTSAYDVPLQELMDRVMGVVERELDWYFRTPRQTTEILDGTGNGLMTIRQYPVIANDKPLLIYERSGVGDSWTLVDSATYEIQRRRLYHATYWIRGLRNYKAEYWEGFTMVPGDVAQFFLDLVSKRVEIAGGEGMKQSERIGDYSYTIASDTIDVTTEPNWPNLVNSWKRGRI